MNTQTTFPWHIEKEETEEEKDFYIFGANLEVVRNCCRILKKHISDRDWKNFMGELAEIIKEKHNIQDWESLVVFLYKHENYGARFEYNGHEIYVDEDTEEIWEYLRGYYEDTKRLRLCDDDHAVKLINSMLRR